MNNFSKIRFHFRSKDVVPKDPLRFAVGACSLGAVLVARGKLGICAVLLDDQPKGLRKLLSEAFPTNDLVEDMAVYSQDLPNIIAFIDAPETASQIELDVGGTPFQQKVWQAICEVPAGKTNCYADVARYVGVSKAARAVASACAANLLAVVVPCHRVVRKDGLPSDYRWGRLRKHQLLLSEAVS